MRRSSRVKSGLVLPMGLALSALAAGESEAIFQEQSNGVAERVYFHYGDPEVALWSFAHPNVDGCTGTMIGPHVLMTAGHCGGATKTATFMVYESESQRSSEQVVCEYLLHTFPETDLRLLYCPVAASGIGYGDRYGYLDFDVAYAQSGGFDLLASRALVPNASVYSIWRNNIALDAGGSPAPPGDHRLYSEGIVTSNTDQAWYTPNDLDYPLDPDPRCDSDVDPLINLPVGAASGLWANPGVSGSTSLRSNNRILLGPLSLSAADNVGRQQLPIAEYIWSGWAEPLVGTSGCAEGVIPQVNESLLTSLGVSNPAQFYGWIDDDLDGLFDVQHELERVLGETSKDWHWLGFESARRNALWSQSANATVSFHASDPDSAFVRIDATGASGYVTALSHSLLHLSSALYRVSFRVHVLTRGIDAPLGVCLGGNCHTVDLPAGASWETVTRVISGNSRLVPGGPLWNPLRFRVDDQAILEIAEVNLARDGASMDFDTHPQRIVWSHPFGSPGLVWPQGRGAAPNWAGVVRSSAFTSFPLRNSHLGIAPGEQGLCFQTRTTADLDPPAGLAAVRVWDDELGSEVPGSRTTFAPGPSWGLVCLPAFIATGEAHTLQLGFDGPETYGSVGYLVDDVVLLPEPGGLAPLVAGGLLLVRLRSSRCSSGGPSADRRSREVIPR